LNSAKENALNNVIHGNNNNKWTYCKYLNKEHCLYNRGGGEYLIQEKTRQYFISILYKNQNNIIELIISPALYLTKNCILSKEFVARYFEYNVLPIEFNIDYELIIMDDELNTITLKPNQYIKLGTKDYSIITEP
jgi:hypothetical protein